jgi:small conductance mechanosensitive channel
MHTTLQKLWVAADHMLDSFIGRLPALLMGIIVFIAFYLLSRLVARAIWDTVSKRRQNLAAIFARLTAGATVSLGLLLALSVAAPSFQTSDLIKILGIGGVAIGFAFQNILQNFVAGILLLWSEPFRVGDEIKIDTFEGRVEEIQARATVVRTYDERRVLIPNADLFTRSVIVNTAFGSRRWQYDLQVKQVTRLEELKEKILAAVRSVSGVLAEPEPKVLIMGINPDSTMMRILWSTHDSRQVQMLASYDQVLTSVAETLDSIAPGASKRYAA